MLNYKKDTIELEKDIKENYFKYFPKYFAEKYAVDLPKIHRIACKLQVTQKYYWLSCEKEIVKKYLNKKTLKELKEEYGISEPIIKKILKKNKIQYRGQREAEIKLCHDENYFEKIDTEEKAYWLGFMYADGNIYQNKIQFRLKASDQKQVEKFKLALKSEHKLSFYTNPKTGFGCTGIMIRSPKIVKDLIKLGCVKNKSLILKEPREKQCPEDLIRHFIRGFFDGDGCLSNHLIKRKKGAIIAWRISFVSTLEMCSFLKRQLDKEIKNCTIKVYKEKRLKTNVYTLGFGKTKIDSISDFYNYIYRDATVFLERKHNKFIEVFFYNEQFE